MRANYFSRGPGAFLCETFLLILAAALPLMGQTQIDIPGPAGSGTFGMAVVPLPNGNIVVTDPFYDVPGGAANVGAVYLYDGATGGLISTLKGSTAEDQIGNAGITVLSNGNFVIKSALWDNGAAANAGAATFGDATSGVSGIVSAANSLVGDSASDLVGRSVLPLPNGHYIVSSLFWDNGAATDAGAVTWANGTTGTSGVVSAANSLVGSNTNDRIGSLAALPFTLISILPNGNYIVHSPDWDNAAATDAGAVTFGDGTSGVSGAVAATNSLVGSTSQDRIGFTNVSDPAMITILPNSNYVVRSRNWDNGAEINTGAVTFGSGTSGVAGAISEANSLVGSIANSFVGSGVKVLTNGNYVVESPSWGTAGQSSLGAATFGSGSTGVAGPVSDSNSLVGSTPNDQVGSSVHPLSTGKYVVCSPSWRNAAMVRVGAATLADGTSGMTGTISPSNSLVGSTNGDEVGGDGVTALTNGNYVVRSPAWNNGVIPSAGAATFGPGGSGIVGVVSPANSLVGSSAGDQVAADLADGPGVVALANGNYVVQSETWDNGMIEDAGAVTFGSGTSGTSGPVTVSNSLVGSSTEDFVGSEPVIALPSGNYLVNSPFWDNGAAAEAGAVTFGSGTSGVAGPISAANALVGSSADDEVGDGITVLTNGSYAVRSPDWNNGGIEDAGAVTFGSGTSGVAGVINAANSLVGQTAFDSIGSGGIAALANGNYVVASPSWSNGGTLDVGAVTFADGSSGIAGSISAMNSLIGSTASDSVGFGFGGRLLLPSGDYVFESLSYDNGAIVNAGAVTYGRGDGSASGPLSSSNSVFGTTPNSNGSLNFSFDATNNQVAVGRPFDNIVTLFRPGAPPLALTAAASRKMHGSAGTFDVALPLSGSPGVECRSSAGNHTLVFTFTNEVVSGSASVSMGTATIMGSPTFSGNTMTVNLTGVTDAQQIKITLSGVTDASSQVLPNTEVTMNVLLGDTTNNSSVTSSDIGQTKAQSGIAVTAANARQDVTANGAITSSDIGLVKSRSGTSIPAAPPRNFNKAAKPRP